MKSEAGHFPHMPDWLIYAVVVAGLLAAAIGRQERADAPPPPPPVEGEEAVPLSPTGPFADEEVTRLADRRRVEVGTAFSVGESGRWLTARHVVAGCDRVALIVAEGRGVLARVATDRANDLALLQTDGGAPGLAVASNPHLESGDRAFHPGFPGGRPGEATSRLLGIETLPGQRRGERPMNVLAWAQSGRTMGVGGSLAGLSGAPVIDARGMVIGMTLAEQPRRGRIYTTLPQTLAHSLAKAKLAPAGAPIGDAVTTENYFRIADALRRDLRVAQVICLT
jgi:serine protease Do